MVDLVNSVSSSQKRVLKFGQAELENRAWILSREWDARRHFREKQFNS